MTGTLDSQELGSYVTVVGILQRHAGKNGGVLYHADGSRISVNVLPMVDCPSWHWYVHALVPEVVTDVPIAASPWTAEIGYTPTVSQTRMLRELKGTTVLASPCGTGKRVMLAWHVRDAGFTTVVVAAPLIASAEQALLRIAPFLPGHTAVAFWSGAGGALDDAALVATLRAGPTLVSTTFASAGRVAACLGEAGTAGEGTCVIVDEAHNLCEGIDAHELAFGVGAGDRTTVLAIATPSRSLREELDELDGSAVIQYGMREAIDNGEVADYTLVIPLVSSKDFRPVELRSLDETPGAWDAMGRAIWHAGCMQHDAARRCIVYLRSVAECDAYETAFAQVCKDFLGVECWARRITCETPAGERAAILREFGAADTGDGICLRIVTSIRILDEAIDVPSCDAVFIADVASTACERASIRIVQRVSRGTRLDPANPHKVARAYLWTADCDDDDLAALTWMLTANDARFPSRVRVASADHDRAVGCAEVDAACHLSLDAWREKYLVRSMSPRELVELKVMWLLEHCSETTPVEIKNRTTLCSVIFICNCPRAYKFMDES